MLQANALNKSSRKSPSPVMSVGKTPNTPTSLFTSTTAKPTPSKSKSVRQSMKSVKPTMFSFPSSKTRRSGTRVMTPSQKQLLSSLSSRRVSRKSPVLSSSLPSIPLAKSPTPAMISKIQRPPSSRKPPSMMVSSKRMPYSVKSAQSMKPVTPVKSASLPSLKSLSKPPVLRSSPIHPSSIDIGPMSMKEPSVFKPDTIEPDLLTKATRKTFATAKNTAQKLNENVSAFVAENNPPNAREMAPVDHMAYHFGKFVLAPGRRQLRNVVGKTRDLLSNMENALKSVKSTSALQEGGRRRRTQKRKGKRITKKAKQVRRRRIKQTKRMRKK